MVKTIFCLISTSFQNLSLHKCSPNSLVGFLLIFFSSLALFSPSFSMRRKPQAGVLASSHLPLQCLSPFRSLPISYHLSFFSEHNHYYRILKGLGIDYPSTVPVTSFRSLQSETFLAVTNSDGVCAPQRIFHQQRKLLLHAGTVVAFCNRDRRYNLSR
jgi:hypothetical protein